jgi:Rrf2 family protein
MGTCPDMLRLTKKADYGLMALKYLAEHPEATALSAKDIAEAYHIPAQLLAKILQRLAKVGLVKSHAGMNGGYALAKDPKRISVFEVIFAIDGPLFITSCFTEEGNCDLTDSCTIKEPLGRINETISSTLKHMHVSDLVEEGRSRTVRELVTIRTSSGEKILQNT